MPASYKDKLANFEVQPPKSAWNIISAELGKNGDLLSISEKLFDYEASPPANTWQAIAYSLETEKQLQPFPGLKSKRSLIYSFMAAASILAAIAISIFYISRVNISASGFTVIQPKKSSPDNNQQPQQGIEAAPLTDESAPTDPVASVVQNPPKARKNFEAPVKMLQTARVKNPLFMENEPGIMIAAKPIRNASGEIIQNTEIMPGSDNQYISITSPNGQQTKISSKFQQMLSFINDDNDEDEVDGYFDKNFLQSLIWKSRFQDWRNKIINTSFVPSSTNFMDILEFRDLIMKDK